MHRIPRGIVDEQVARTKFTLVRHPPAAELRELVEYYWLLRWDLTEPHVQRVLPNLSVHVTFFPGTTAVHGPMRDVFTYRLEGRVHGIAARWRPGCFRPFLNAPVRTVAGRSVDVTEIFGANAADVATRIRNARTDEEMITAIDNLLMACRRPVTTAGRAAAEAVETIAADAGITRVTHLAAATGVSVRALQRLFAEHVGSTPKQAIRIYRLDEAARVLAAEPAPDYAGLATRLGYSDQPHFIRDFRAVTGRSPGAFSRSAHDPMPDNGNGRRE
ncbi:AraC family transcriptional regulator [Amycolatopsis jiangsuensis]|uniref:AraC-like DNA-binding protein n=1 Tax=Amycolatopsis jiangsuensis TaxID=1181879 RepID=A0A840J311_9PSEU|nr:helix-turn-helix domain-containing protein [Amycolatopsis jiangsuensis]MBB4687798.1 AraC-like DNA-binding protein [Amycolatopsis jiangsuensis]